MAALLLRRAAASAAARPWPHASGLPSPHASAFSTQRGPPVGVIDAVKWSVLRQHVALHGRALLECADYPLAAEFSETPRHWAATYDGTQTGLKAAAAKAKESVDLAALGLHSQVDEVLEAAAAEFDSLHCGKVASVIVAHKGIHAVCINNTASTSERALLVDVDSAHDAEEQLWRQSTSVPKDLASIFLTVTEIMMWPAVFFVWTVCC